MNCTHIEKLLPLHVEGDLDADQEALVLVHLEACRRCCQLMAEYQKSQHWLRSYTPPEFSPEFDDALFDDLSAAVRKERAREDARPGFLQLIAPLWGWRPALASAMVLLAIVSGLALYARLNRQPVKSTPEQAHQRPTLQSTPDNQKAEVTQSDGVSREGAIDESTSSYPKPQSPKSAPQEAPAIATLAMGLPLAIARVLPPEAVAEYQNEVAASKNEATALERLLARFSKPEVPAEPENPGTESPASTNTSPAPEVMRIEMQTANPNVRIIWLAPKETNSQSNKTDRDTN